MSEEIECRTLRFLEFSRVSFSGSAHARGDRIHFVSGVDDRS